jgi:dolichol-phosphate mannosyltransferase
MQSCSIIIPVYQEPRIEKTIKNLIDEFRYNKINNEIIIVVDKAPNDNTDQVVKRIAKTYNEIHYSIRNEKKGVADAIKEGIRNATNEVSIIVMADGSEKPKDLVKILLKMSEGYDMVMGNRFAKGVEMKSYPRKKMIANRLCNIAIRIFFNFNSKDITNAVKAYRTEILKKINLESKGFEIFAEIPLKIFKSGFKNFTF